MLNAKTKKYQLEPKTFVKVGLTNVIRTYWYAFLVPVLIILPGIYFTGALGWLIFSAILITILYLLFWAIQFYGATQVPQGKPMFEKLFYELDNKNIFMKKNDREGMQIPWEQVQKVEKTKEAYIFYLGKFQFLYLPYSIFNSELELKFSENIMRRKKLLPALSEDENPANKPSVLEQRKAKTGKRSANPE
jgi:YcxB-like protein